jgi:hypothetical protein
MREETIDKAGEYASWGARDWLADDEGSHGALPPKEPGHPTRSTSGRRKTTWTRRHCCGC